IIMQLDLAQIVAGTKYRGQFEERIKLVFNEVEKSNGKIILYIDELHQVLGAGSAEGALDMSGMLLQQLTKPRFRMIGATTLKEFTALEKNGAIHRRLVPVKIGEPSKKESIAVLRGLKAGIEKEHGVEIQDEAIRAAVKYADQYSAVTGHHLPDSAVDLV